MKLRSIRYYIREAVTNLFRNSLMTLASIGTVMSCIFILSISFAVAANIDFILHQFGTTLGFSVIIERDTDSDTVNALYNKIAAIDNIKAVKYVSSAEALQRMTKDLKDNKGILAGLEKDNPLPRSFEITVADPAFQEEVVKSLEELLDLGIEEINYESNIANMLVAINNGIRIVSFFIIAALFAIAVVIIVNTVKLTVNSRKTDINIMKYVGATDWFIRWPFIIEGILIGIIGAVIPLLIGLFGYGQIINFAYDNLKILNNLILFLPVAQIYNVLVPFALALGIVIGAFGSAFSIKKYLKV